MAAMRQARRQMAAAATSQPDGVSMTELRHRDAESEKKPLV
jgi:hypothetical protein